MRRTASLIALATAVSVVALPSQAAAAGPHRGMAFSATAHPAKHWLRKEVRVLRHDGGGKVLQLGAKPGFLPQLSAAPAKRGATQRELFADLEPVGHLGGHSGPVVLDSRFVGSALVPELGLTARDGATGAAIWQRTLTIGNALDLQFLPARIGSNGQLGLIEFELDEADNPDGSGNVSLTTTALSGATGHTVWTQTTSGGFDTTGFETNIPGLFDLLNTAAPAADKVLVDLNTTLNIHTGQTTAEVISGIDGSTTAFGGTYTATNEYPVALPVSDLSGDGTDDVVATQGSKTGSVIALNGATGAQLWATPLNVRGATDIEPIGHFSDTHVSDVAIGVEGNHAHGKYSVLAGTDGHVVVTAHGDSINAIGTAGKNLVPAVQFLSFRNPFGFGKTTSTGIHIATVNATGGTIYAKTIRAKVKLPPNADSSNSDGGFNPAGDVQPDGSLDLSVDVQIEANSFTRIAHARKRGIVDGRTGDFTKVPATIPADGSLQHGQGTDLLAETIHKGQVKISGWDGETGKRLYRTTLHLLTGVKNAGVTGLRATGHSCSDQALIEQNKTIGVEGILTATGAPVWTVRFGPSKAVGGKVTQDKVHGSYCVSHPRSIHPPSS